MKVCVLGSGSGGNAIFLEACGVRILIDAGFSGVEVERRLAGIQVAPESLAGIVLTHDHRDHSMGVGILARRHGLPLYLTERTHAACRSLLTGEETVIHYRAGASFTISPRSVAPTTTPAETGTTSAASTGVATIGASANGAGARGLRIEPFVTVHDAADPVAVAAVCMRSGLRLGIATDLGRSTAGIRHALSDCDFLVLEANHCKLMLGRSRYPASVKQRIASSHGHLSNEAAAQLAIELLHPRLAGILLAHLSEECNRPDLARGVVGGALERAGFRGFLDVARQDRPTSMIDIERVRAATGPDQLTLL